MGANTSATLKNARGTGGTAIMSHVGLQSTAAASTAGTALSGARVPTSWAAWSGGTSSTTQTNNVASGESVASIALYSALTAGTFLDAVTVTTQAFASAGTYASTVTDTQS